MKKLICVLMAVVVLLSSCVGENGGEISEAISDAVSGDTSATPDSSFTLDKALVDQMVADRADAIKGEANRVGSFVDHALGKPYTVSEGNENKFQDKKNYLTDGSLNDTHFKFVKDGWMGIIKNGASITVDLGEVTDNLSDFVAYTCRNSEYEVDMCAAMFVYISDDGESWKNIGICYTSGLEKDKARHNLSVALDGVVSARYVKFTFDGLTNNFMLLDELGVYSYSGEKQGSVNTLNEYYGAKPVPVITEDKYFSESDGDYNTHKNLLLGLNPVTYECITDVAETMLAASYNTKPNTAHLTDGKFAKQAGMNDSAWFRNTHGTGRSAVYDFGGIVSIDEAYANFLADAAPGIKLPENFSVSVSLDGDEWFTVYEDFKDADQEKAIVKYGGKFDKAYKARYVKLSYSCTVHTYVDELEVYGMLNATAAADPSETLIEAPTVTSEYGKPEEYDGMHDIALSYLLPPLDGSEVKVTKEQYLAYVAYLEEGEIKDTFFDGFMYLPYVKYLYEKSEKKQLTKEEWQAWTDYQFIEGYNFDALDAATDEVKAALDLDEDYSVGTYLSLFYPVYGATNFGELNGKQMDFSNIEDRKAVLKWFIDEQLAAFNAKGYDSVRVSGFYWFVEEMSGKDPHIRELVNYACDYVRSLGYQTTWIPYFSASGNTAWRDYGFDTACLQPNYAFKSAAESGVTIQRIYDAAALAKLYGMSIEIEIEGAYDVQWVNRYREYLYVGAEIGFMTDSVHMYYLAGMPGAVYDAYVSKKPEINCMYRETYLFAKGLLSANQAAPTADNLTCKAGEGVTGTLTLANSTVPCEDVRVAVGAENGTVIMSSDGTFTYMPYPGFTGTDTFTVVADYGIAGLSEFGVITVTVE